MAGISFQGIQQFCDFWNKNVFGRVESNNKEALERIFHWARSDYSKSTRVKS